MAQKCLDTYALMEIATGNPRFTAYLDVDFVITDVTLAEFYGVIYREYNKKTAQYWYDKLAKFSVPVDKSVFIDAMLLRIKYPRLSFFDVVGYAYSQAHRLAFVTGDEDFRGKKGVEFVKK